MEYEEAGFQNFSRTLKALEAAQDNTEIGQENKTPAKEDRETRDLYNLVSIDDTTYILQEHGQKRFISMKKPTLNKMYLKATLSCSKWYEQWRADALDKITAMKRR